VVTLATGAPAARPVGTTRPPLPPGLRLPYDPNGREWRKPPRPAGVASAAPADASVGGAPPEPGSGPASYAFPVFPAVLTPERPPLLGKVAPCLQPQAVPSAVRSWLVGRNAALVAADWPHVRDVFEAAPPRDASVAGFSLLSG